MKLINLRYSSVLVLFLFVVALPLLFGQTASTGALTGTIKDPSGAVVPNVVVTTTNIATGQSRTTTSDSSGVYKVVLLPPGNYRVRFEAQGFRAVEVPSIAIIVTETQSLDFKLEIGAQSEQITVQASTEVIQTESSTLGSVVSGSTITDLPLSARNYTNLLALSAGASALITNAADLGKGTQSTAVGGAGILSNNYQMDGASVVNYSSQSMTEQGSYGSIGIPNPDSIQEFKIQTSNYDASYGRATGASVNVMTRSGSNDFHGSLFEFFRNTALNANDWFANRTGAKRGQLNQHQFGFTLGGPVKKDKLLFFTSFQETAQKNGLRTGLGSWYSMNLPLGNRGTCPKGATSLSQCDSEAQNFIRALGANYAGQVGWTNFGVPVAADGSNINPVALQILQLKLPNGAYYLPSPNGPNTAPGISCSGLNCTASKPAIYHEYQGIGNFDYIINSKQTLSGRYFVSVSPRTMTLIQGTTVPGLDVDTEFNNHNAVLSLTSVPSNSLVNEVRGSFQRAIVRNRPSDLFSATQVGMVPVHYRLDYLPQIAIGNINFGTPIFQNTDQATNTYQISDQLSWIRGKHSLRFGFEGSYIRWNWTFPGLGTGNLQMNTHADFLLGLPGCTPGTFPFQCNAGNPGGTNGTFASNIFMTGPTVTRFIEDGGWDFYRRSRYTSAFVQDDIKVAQRFTLNLGLRWEYFGYPAEKSGKQTNLNLQLISPTEVPQVSAPCRPNVPCPGSSLVGYTVPENFPGTIPAGVMKLTNNSAVQESPAHNFGPRVGFAWQPFESSKFVIRGGGGIFYEMGNGMYFVFSTQQNPPYAITVGGFVTDVYYATLQKPYSDDIQPYWIPRWVAYMNGQVLSSNLGGYSMADDWTTPATYTWNLNVQYEFLPSYVLEVGYVGSRGVHQYSTFQYNAAPLKPAAITGEDPTAANYALRVPALGVAASSKFYNSVNGDMKYNSLQVTVRKRLSHGLSFQTSYTLSRAFNTEQQVDSSITSIDDHRYPLVLSYGRNPAYSPHRFTLQFAYDFPAVTAGGFGGKLLDGWRISGQTTIQNGRPMTISDSGLGQIFGSMSGTNAQFCSGKGVADVATSGTTQDRVNAYFNKQAFTGGGTCDASKPMISDSFGGGNSGRGIILGPGQNNWDISLIKRTKVGGVREDAILEFRTEFFNAFNHPQFANPGNTNLTSNVFGQITTTSVNPRLIQFALKYMF